MPTCCYIPFAQQIKTHALWICLPPQSVQDSKDISGFRPNAEIVEILNAMSLSSEISPAAVANVTTGWYPPAGGK